MMKEKYTVMFIVKFEQFAKTPSLNAPIDIIVFMSECEATKGDLKVDKYHENTVVID